MPLGNSTHRFSANKEWFFLRTNSLLISKARPTHQWIPVLCMQSPRSETAGQGWPSAQDVLCRVCFTHSSSLYSGAVFCPRRCPWFPWWCIRLSQGGVVPSLLRLQLSTAETTSQADVGHQPFCALHSVLRPGAGAEEAAAKHGCVLPVPGPGLSVSQRFTENNSSLSFWIFLFHGGPRWSLCSPACAQNGL